MLNNREVNNSKLSTPLCAKKARSKYRFLHEINFI